VIYSGFIQQVSRDLQQEFPDIKGFSYRNLRAVKQWYCFYQHDIVNLATGCSQIANEEESIVQQLVAQLEDAPIFQIPWGQNLVILSKSADIKEALFYVHKTIENNWSRAVLTHQIESGLYQRQGKAVSYDKVLCIDIQETLDTCQAWCATKVALPMNRVSQFGSEALASPVDGSVEGFCKSSHQTIVEYSLKDMHKPMGVSEYELTRHLPDNLKSSLPSIADIEAELGVGDV